MSPHRWTPERPKDPPIWAQALGLIVTAAALYLLTVVLFSL